MGGNYAPSYANQTMGHWEDLNIWQPNPFAQHLVFYGRHIDNVIIWDGPSDTIP